MHGSFINCFANPRHRATKGQQNLPNLFNLRKVDFTFHTGAAEMPRMCGWKRQLPQQRGSVQRGAFACYENRAAVVRAGRAAPAGLAAGATQCTEHPAAQERPADAAAWERAVSPRHPDAAELAAAKQRDTLAALGVVKEQPQPDEEEEEGVTAWNEAALTALLKWVRGDGSGHDPCQAG